VLIFDNNPGADGGQGRRGADRHWWRVSRCGSQLPENKGRQTIKTGGHEWSSVVMKTMDIVNRTRSGVARKGCAGSFATALQLSGRV